MKNTSSDILMNIKDSRSVRNYVIFTTLMLLYLSSGYYIVVTGALSGFISVIIQLALVVLGLMFTKHKSMNSLNLKSIFLVLLLLSSGMFSILYRSDSVYDYAILFFAVVTGYLFTTAFSFEQFIKSFNKVMYFLALYSLLIYALNIFIPSVFSFAPLIDIRFGRNVLNLGFSVLLSNATIPRNYGFFWEPGAYQTFLNLALIFEFFYYKKINRKHIGILILTIFTTFSTVGYVAMGVIILAYFFKIGIENDFLTRHKKRLKFFLISTLVLFFVYIIIPDYYMQVTFGKLDEIFQGSEVTHVSTKTRVDSIIYPLREFIRAPIIGIGYENFNIMSQTYLNSKPTNTSLNWFALLGIIWGIPCNYYYVKNIKKLNAPFISKLFIIAAMLLIISTESYLRNVMIYILIFYGTQNLNQSQNTKSKAIQTLN